MITYLNTTVNEIVYKSSIGKYRYVLLTTITQLSLIYQVVRSEILRVSSQMRCQRCMKRDIASIRAILKSIITLVVYLWCFKLPNRSILLIKISLNSLNCWNPKYYMYKAISSQDLINKYI